jgi:flagellar basal body-associated protein FliL
MEARRTFHGARSYRQLWIILAALMVAACLGVAGAFVANGVGSPSKAPQVVKTYPAPGTVLNQDKANGPGTYIPGKTDF